MISPKNKFSFPKDMVGNKPIFSREKVVEMERHVRCIIPPRFSWSKVACGKVQKNFLKAIQDSKEEDIEAKSS